MLNLIVKFGGFLYDGNDFAERKPNESLNNTVNLLGRNTIHSFQTSAKFASKDFLANNG